MTRLHVCPIGPQPQVNAETPTRLQPGMVPRVAPEQSVQGSAYCWVSQKEVFLMTKCFFTLLVAFVAEKGEENHSLLLRKITLAARGWVKKSKNAASV